MTAKFELPSPPSPALPRREGADRSRGSRTRSVAKIQLTWLALEPLTGRTHQLRVHCAAMGWPILGDTIYGNAPAQPAAPGCICMRARSSCRSTRTARRSRSSAPVPLHMHATLQACGWQGEVFKLID